MSRADALDTARTRARPPRPSPENPPCFHGGAFFDAIGTRFDDLGRRRGIINADVLDAWFDPSPRVLDALREHLPWLLRTSPPTHAEGLIREIGQARDVPEECLVVGPGSSDLIFRTIPRWLTRRSRALVLDPTYGEYAHVLEHVIGCRVDRLRLRRDEDFDVPIGRLTEALRAGYDLVVIVNPNNPTGRSVQRSALEEVIECAPIKTRFWIDEAYLDYVGLERSLESFASRRPGVVVCKTMSKVYALSGLRVGYLCCEPVTAGELRAFTPPWAVGLPAQVAAVAALQDPGYYHDRYRETHKLREELADALGLDTLPSRTNGLLAFLPDDGPTAAEVVRECRNHGLFLRDPSVTCPTIGRHTIRFAVKDETTNGRMVETFREAVGVLGSRA